MSADADAALEAFHAHLDQLEAESGVELDAGERQRVFGLSVAGGFSPESTLEAFSELVPDDDDYEYEQDDDPTPGTDRLIRHVGADFERLSAEYGRPLTAHEKEIIANGAVEQAERFDQISPEEALDDYYRANPGERRPDTRTQEGRGEFFKQRLAEMDEPAEPDPDREYDLGNQDDRHAYLEARMQGHEFEDTFE